MKNISQLAKSTTTEFEKKVVKALHTLRCNPVKTSNVLPLMIEDEAVVTYEYKFQGESFKIALDSDLEEFRVTLPILENKPASELQLLSMVCNDANIDLQEAKCALTHDASGHSYTLQTMVHEDYYDGDDLDWLISSSSKSLFDARVLVLSKYENYQLFYGQERPWEERDAMACKEHMHLVHSEKLLQVCRDAHYSSGLKYSPKEKGQKYSMADVAAFSPMMEQLLPVIAPTWQVDQISYMKILCDEYTYVDDLEDILLQPVLAPMVDGQGSRSNVRMKDCTYILGDRQDHTFTMHIQYKGENKRRIIFRLTVLHDELYMHKTPHNLSRAATLSMMVCIDKVEEDRRKAEFRYMKADAQDKIRARMEQDLTMAQSISTLSPDDEVKELLYVGTKHFISKCYAQALISLQQAYHRLDVAFENAKRLQKHYLTECLYMIGYCLDEMGQFEQAYYYLSLIPTQSSARCEAERLYCYEHLNDHMLITHLLKQRFYFLKCYHWDPDSVDEEYSNFYVRLVHVLTEAYIKARRYDDAEDLLHEEVRNGRLQDCAEGLLLRIRSEKESVPQRRAV